MFRAPTSRHSPRRQPCRSDQRLVRRFLERSGDGDPPCDGWHGPGRKTIENPHTNSYQTDPNRSFQIFSVHFQISCLLGRVNRSSDYRILGLARNLVDVIEYKPDLETREGVMPSIDPFTLPEVIEVEMALWMTFPYKQVVNSTSILLRVYFSQPWAVWTSKPALGDLNTWGSETNRVRR